MKAQSILIYLTILVINVNAETKPKSLSSINKVSSPEERRKLPLFPKSIKKYVYINKPVEKIQLSTSRTTTMTKRTLMPRLLFKNINIEVTTKSVYKESTRKPLMKFKKFTIDTPSVELVPETIIDKNIREPTDLNSHESKIESTENFENDDEDDVIAGSYSPTKHAYTETQDKYDINSIEPKNKYIEDAIVIKHSTTTENAAEIESETTVETEHSIETEGKDNENVIEANIDINFGVSNDNSDEYDYTTEGLPGEIIEPKNNKSKSKQMRTEVITDSTSSKSEKEDQLMKDDLNEFIFIKKLSTNTTESKKKRSINIIEEEDRGITTPRFKFTGREFHLTNDLAYKNINA